MDGLDHWVSHHDRVASRWKLTTCGRGRREDSYFVGSDSRSNMHPSLSRKASKDPDGNDNGHYFSAV